MCRICVYICKFYEFLNRFNKSQGRSEVSVGCAVHQGPRLAGGKIPQIVENLDKSIVQRKLQFGIFSLWLRSWWLNDKCTAFYNDLEYIFRKNCWWFKQCKIKKRIEVFVFSFFITWNVSWTNFEIIF